MSHLDEGTLHALLDGELEVHEVAEIQAHLGSCSSCGLRLREVKEFLAEADRLIASVELDARVEMPAPRREPLVAAASTPAAARPEPTVAPRPAPEPAREERPRPTEAPAAWEPWNEQVPVILVPDNESPAERRRHLVQRFGWAAMVLILIGAGVVGRMTRPVPTRTLVAGPGARVDSGAIVSAEETVRPDRAAAQSPDTARTTLASNSEAPAKPAAKAPASTARRATPAPTRAAEKQPDAKELASVRTEAFADTSGPSADERDTVPTEDLATVRRRAADALADLDREKRRNQAAAATAALDAEKRRRAAQGLPKTQTTVLAPAAAAPAPPPTPPTAEERAQVYLRIGLDEASRQLGGPAHVIEGMSAMFMGLAQGVTVPGAEATRPVVRVVYQDTQGRLIFLDQQRIRPGQTLPATTPLSWVQGDIGMWLHGEVGPDILRTYRPRVR